jgi:hypothetical protein
MVLNHTSTRCWVTHAPVGLGAMPNGLPIPSGSQTSSLIEMDMQYLSRLFCYRAKVCAAVRAALATHTWCIAPDTRSVQLHTHTAATDRTKLSRDIGAVWMYPPPSYDKSPSPSPPRRHVQGYSEGYVARNHSWHVVILAHDRRQPCVSIYYLSASLVCIASRNLAAGLFLVFSRHGLAIKAEC